MGLLFCFLSFLLVVRLGWRSLGRGVGATLAVGFFYGILRGRFPDGYSHFMFDSALLGLYLSQFSRAPSREVQARTRAVKAWTLALGLWPLVAILTSIGLPTAQPLAIQLVGLRASVLFLPVLVLGGRMSPEDMSQVYRWILALTPVAFVFALLELRFGVETFFPLNDITAIIHMSSDVGEERFLRIPATFGNAHAYAGTMLGVLPILMGWERRARWRVVRIAVLVAAVLGIFISGARTPVIQLGLMVVLLVLTTPLPRGWLAGMAVVGVIVAYVVSDNPRFRRFETLEDTDYVQERVSWSLNKSLFEVVSDFPMGSGLGSAAGTNVPFFLMSEALPQLGLENEYGRIALEQGLPGLVLWACFILWALLRRPKDVARRWGLFQLRLMWILSLLAWGNAMIGTGLLTSIPFTLLLMLQMGLVASEARAPAAATTAPLAARAVQV